jgi:hypothetical protein
MWPFTKEVDLDKLTEELPREELLRRARCVILDDQSPEFLSDLQGHGLAVEHWTSTDNPSLARLETGFYDLLLLDYSGVGSKYGKAEGLDFLRHLKRVNKSLVILAFTGKTFDSSKADFFRLTDGVIKKDSGIADTLAEVERHLSRALTPAYQWNAFLLTLNITDHTSREAKALQKVFSKHITGTKSDLVATLTAATKALATAALSSAAKTVAPKLLELAIAHLKLH